MALKKYQLDQETLKLLNILESSEDDDRRRSAIFSLAKQGGMNSARILIETFERTMWRSTKFLIIQALGQVQHERATEFLCQTAMGIDDFAMAAEAVLALGHPDDPVAGEFLANITNSSDHPLLRESLSALANMNYFPCQHELSDFLGEKGTDVPTSVFQNAVIAAGLRGYSKFLGTIQNILQRESSGPIFNTTVMALGRIGNDESAKLLEQLDTRYRAFAHQLKLAALEHIRLRLSLTIEDAVSAALTANSPRSIRQAWQVLATFPEDARKEAIHLLAGDAPCAFRAMERLVFFNKKSLFDDLKFLAENSGSLSKELFAGIARQHVLVHSRDEFLKAALTHGAPFLIRLLNYVRIEKADDLLFEILSNDQISKDLKFSAVNALVAQSLMLGVKFIAIQPLAMDFRTSYGKRLVRLIESEQDDALKARLLRAIGQIHYLGPDAANLLRDILKTPSQVTDAAYSALALCNSEEATKIISKRLRQIIASDDHRNEVASAIRGLARCDLVSDASCLVQISHDTKNNL
jgi:HEAT repeat protein